jgi:hypothetical protein
MNFNAYREAKQRHPNMLLLFRASDSFELCGDDAETAAKILGFCVTTRTDGNTGPFKEHKMSRKLPDLSDFCGSDEAYRHGTDILYTQGIDFVAKTCGAFWLIDVVASAQFDKNVRAEEFQIWNLKVTGSSAVITCQADTNWPVVYRQEIEYTDFPEGEFKMFFEHGTLCLPSER